MTDMFDAIEYHFTQMADELRSQANQAGLLNNPADKGAEREEIFRDFLDRHLPASCDVFLGGYVFDAKGNRSQQIDIIVTNDLTPRFRLSSGHRFIAPLEGTIATVEVKSRLDKEGLEGNYRPN